MYRVNPASLILNFFATGGAGTEHSAGLSAHISQQKQKIANSGHMCLILFGLIVSILAPPPRYTIIRQMFLRRKEPHFELLQP